MANRTKTRIENLHLKDLKPEDKIAPNFYVHELTRSDLALRLGIDNSLPGNDELRAAVHLTREVMQPIRDAQGRFFPNSVFRSQALERVLKKRPPGWVSTSQHCLGCACDIEIPGLTTLELAKWAAANLPDYDQIICECFDPRQGPNSGWVHISLKPPGQGTNRRQLLSYIRDPASGRWVYVPGLQGAAP
jgi:hypothetical protein